MGLFLIYNICSKNFCNFFLKKICKIKIKELSLYQEKKTTKQLKLTTMTTTFTQQYTIVANSPKYGVANVEMTINFNNEDNTSVITFGDGWVCGGQTTGYNGDGVALANSSTNNNTIKLYSLSQLTKLGTNHITLYKSDEVDFNKQTRFICELTMVAMTIKKDIYNWRKSLVNEQ